MPKLFLPNAARLVVITGLTLYITGHPIRAQAAQDSSDSTQKPTTESLRSAAEALQTASDAVRAAGQPTPDDCSTATPSCSTVRWELDTNASTGSGSQTDKKTSSNLLFKLDWLARAPTYNSSSFKDGFVSHLVFRTGFTEATVADKVKPAPSGSGTAPATQTCPGASSTSASGGASATTANCTILAPRQAFVAELAANLGWTIGFDGSGTAAEYGLGLRGAFQSILQTDQVIQSAGVNYLDFSRDNLRDAVGLYEVVGRFKLGGWNHDQHDIKKVAGKEDKLGKNIDDLLVIEAGYQNNSAFQHLIDASPKTNTRNRFIGRFLAYPEIDKQTHTKVLIGLEYNAGLNGGPREVRLLYGVNLTLDKLFHPDPKQ